MPKRKQKRATPPAAQPVLVCTEKIYVQPSAFTSFAPTTDYGAPLNVTRLFQYHYELPGAEAPAAEPDQCITVAADPAPMSRRKPRSTAARRIKRKRGK